MGKVPPKGAEEGGTTLDIQKQFGEMVFASSDLAGARPPSPEGKALLAKFFFTVANYFAISRATWTPLAEAWDREWVMPLPSPMIYRPG